LSLIKERCARKQRYQKLIGVKSPVSEFKSVELTTMLSKSKRNYNVSSTTKVDEQEMLQEKFAKAKDRFKTKRSLNFITGAA
jgi:hypothetical protein